MVRFLVEGFRPNLQKKSKKMKNNQPGVLLCVACNMPGMSLYEDCRHVCFQCLQICGNIVPLSLPHTTISLHGLEVKMICVPSSIGKAKLESIERG